MLFKKLFTKPKRSAGWMLTEREQRLIITARTLNMTEDEIQGIQVLMCSGIDKENVHRAANWYARLGLIPALPFPESDS